METRPALSGPALGDLAGSTNNRVTVLLDQSHVIGLVRQFQARQYDPAFGSHLHIESIARSGRGNNHPFLPVRRYCHGGRIPLWSGDFKYSMRSDLRCDQEDCFA
jgi:hypothetical protein